ncbi:zinc-binding alcohol dehydrogenase family protein [Lactobacillus sp. ESL0677]|uniref:zinc-binding alcohol dehydrogenase family protein n=1 Tax=Lactobacillus sp. ESL0677 TaxID=2983208 RepID=UPI0023F8EFA1|nr:zinc-binding alcohol dehydrogenase family protein [Lactobacillus sp. ESL0677]WEV36179.1 zinc-binding alcohol dehydrogenase family protein [Lactobacillus sp. ESL0677]
MKAIGFTKSLPIEDNNSLFEFDMACPEPTNHDLLVKVEGVSVNPVDLVVRQSLRKKVKQPKVIGYDAVGVVTSIGNKVDNFKIGDRIFYAGALKRAGSNSEYQLVDEHIVAKVPQELTDAEVAAMPLTSLTAYEALFEKMQLTFNVLDNKGKTILIINGAGGVGSIAIQLAHLAGLTVIATASRPETRQWCLKLGADYVVNHRKDLCKEVQKIGFKDVDCILELNNIDQHWNEMAEIIKPDGIICSITENKQPIDLQKLTRKRVTFVWEWMFSKTYYHVNEASQGKILSQIASLLANQTIKSTVTTTLAPINATNLRKAHKMVQSGHMIGKVVVVNQIEN